MMEKADKNKNPAADPDEDKSSSVPPAQESVSASSGSDPEKVSLVDELGVEDIDRPVYGGRGRVFAAAGRNSPVAEFTDDFLVLHPPQLPFEDEEAESEVIVIRMDEDGILINELGARKKVPGAKFQGRELYYYWEQKPGTMKHYAVYFDDEHKPHYLLIDTEKLTVDIIYQLRNMTHDGELSRFTEISVV